MNKELSQLINKKSFVDVDKRSLLEEQLKQVVATRWVITTRPSNSGTQDCSLSGFLNDKGCSLPFLEL
eukprot:2284781-Amphidinium_carterae.1